MAFSRRDGPEVWHDAASTAISPGYFQTMGIPLLAGRDFTESEYGMLNTTDGVVILSRALAERMFPDGGALGARLNVQYPEKMQVRVVGIVGDVRGRPLTADPEAFAYEPAGQRWPVTWANVVVRSALPLSQVAAAAREVMRSVDPAFTPPLVESYESIVDRVLAEQRLLARLSSLFAAVAGVLAGIGIYAMMAALVAERRKEFGIRLALGARGSAVLGLVLQSSALLTSVGLALGIAGAVSLSRVIESKLYGVSRFDPLTLTAATSGIFAVAIVASLVPAWRAARVDPVKSLRVE
jgi:hypothetical protein